jgi:hypothetical protein
MTRPRLQLRLSTLLIVTLLAAGLVVPVMAPAQLLKCRNHEVSRGRISNGTTATESNGQSTVLKASG